MIPMTSSGSTPHCPFLPYLAELVVEDGPWPLLPIELLQRREHLAQVALVQAGHPIHQVLPQVLSYPHSTDGSVTPGLVPHPHLDPHTHIIEATIHDIMDATI